MGDEYLKNSWYKTETLRPPDDRLLLVCNGAGFMELVYVENGQTYKPWRFDDEDTPTLHVDKIKEWMLIDIPVHTNQEIADSLE